MSDGVAIRAGNALFWKSLQYAGTKGIFLVRLFVLARLLSPDDFGLLAVSVVVIDVLMSVTNVGMIPALVQRDELKEIHYHAAWTVGMIRAAVIAIIVFATAPLIAQLFREPRATELIRVLALRPLLEASASIKVADLVRNLNFRRFTLIKLPEALTNTIVAISLAPFLGVWALVLGSLAGPFASLIVSYFLAPYRPRLFLYRKAVGSLIQFGKWIFLSGLLATGANSVLRLVIARQLGTVELGLYFLAARLAFLPADIAGEVMGSVAFPLYSRLQSEARKTQQAFQALVKTVYAILLPVCMLMIALAPMLTDVLLGPKWSGTAPLIRVLALASVIGLFGENVVPLLKGVGQPHKVVMLEAVQSFLLISLIWTLAENFGLIGVALAWLPAIFASQWLSILFVRRILPNPFSALGPTLMAILFASLSGALLAGAASNLLPGMTGFVVIVLLVTGFMATCIWFLDRRLQLSLAADLTRVFPGIVSWTAYASGLTKHLQKLR